MDKPFPAYQGDEPCVFVCYAHDDEDVVYPEIRWLHEQGVNLWYDEGISAGRIWRQEIGDSIKGASSVLYYISNSSLVSDHCNREINFALDEGKDVVPVYLEDVELTTDLKVGLNRVQALHRHQDASYQQHLLNALGQLTTTVEPPGVVRKKPSWQSYAIAASIIGLLFGSGWWYRQAVETTDLVAEEQVQRLGPPLTAIAVLPFEDLSLAGDQAWLANGMTDELIQSLSRIDELRIPGRTSTASLKHQRADIGTIGERLGVGTVIEGSVRLARDLLYVVAHWVRVEDETQLWSARYERTLDDVFDVQQEIAISVAEVIRTELGIKDATEAMMNQRYQPSDVRVWALVRKGIDLIWSFDPENAPEAVELLRRAIEIDPSYATAHAELAKIYGIRALPEYDAARAVQLANRALELQPTNSSAHWLLARESIEKWDYEAAEARLLSAIAANPNDSSLTFPYVQLLWSTGRLKDALQEARRGVKIEPLEAPQQQLLGTAFLVLGNHQAALERYEYAQTLGPINPDWWVYVAIAYHRNGRDADALEAMVRQWPPFEKAIRNGFTENGWVGMGLAFAESLGYPAADVCPAALLALAGLADEMYTCLERELDRPFGDGPRLLNSSPSFAAYRRDPRFQELIVKMNEIRRIVSIENAGSS